MAEIELKFELAAKAHAQFKRLPALSGARPLSTRLTATYFDTPDHALRNRGMGLRLRHHGKRWIQTLKAGARGAGGLHTREEWEFDRPGPTLDLAPLAGTPLDAEPDLASRLVEIFTVEMTRTSWEVEVSPGSRVEVALDRGEVRHGERAEMVSEVEIESLAGDPLSVFEMADRLAAAPGAPVMRPSNVTKAQRGYRLAGGEALLPERAQPVDLDAALSPARAARSIAAAALAQLQANEAGVRAGDDPEYLHQFRVALRRLRSALGVFRAVAGADAGRLREELRWIAGLTGPARDWDVFETATLPELIEARGDAAAARALKSRAAARRRAANAELRRGIESARYARLLLDLARWLAEPSLRLDGEDTSLAQFAQAIVGKRHKRLLADARRLSASSPAERHALRLDAKRLRYALEGLATLFARKRLSAHLEALSEIQDDLGRANDAAVAARLLAELSPPAALAGFARGWFAAQAQGGAAGLERHARKLESLKKLKAVRTTDRGS